MHNYMIEDWTVSLVNFIPAAAWISYSWEYQLGFHYIQSAKILLLPPKYEIIMVPYNHSFFQYCDSNIRLFFFTPCKVITLNPLCILFGISSLLLFYDSLKLIAIVVALSSDSKKDYSYSFRSVKEQQLLLLQ